ncbi:Guanylyl cyclase-activating protein 2 [Liparis tanakae]|uniref:Zona pellucida sperm-binding protein 3 n=1 Tax=Liparis tanakae TaxID=230148 RepID=A0A4Z2G4R4_9TELE|nr:Guanylyl cyclase-activating protein 2 [Liparis tanakae]
MPISRSNPSDVESVPRRFQAAMGQTQPTANKEIDVQAIQEMYKKFVTECPSGLLFLHEFKSFFGVDPTGEASDYAENIFRAYDRNEDNTIDFLEFVAALNLAFRGDLEHKLRWSFKVYDKNGNGFVDKEELRSIIDSLYRIKKGIKTDMCDPQLSADEVADRILRAVDSDGDGHINLQEFIRGAQGDPWVLNMLQLDMNPAGWVLEQRRGTHAPHASTQTQITGSSRHSLPEKAPAAGRPVNTVRVTCHPDALEVVIDADMFGVGAPVNGEELRLGVERDDYCRATASSGDEFRILVGLVDCGTNQRMTEDALVYTNLLVFSPLASPDGLIRMEEAVIPIECRYERKYSLSSSPLMPTWIPFMSKQAAEETLEFDLRIMRSDWLHPRSSNVFTLGEPIGIEASVRVGHHTALRVFVSRCVATLHPDAASEPRYVLVDNGCLVESELPRSRARFFSRTQNDTLRFTIDAFKFHNAGGELYITCHLDAVRANNAEAPNKACTFVNGRWRSADGNDYLCGYCQRRYEPSSPGKFGPRGFGKPEKPELLWSGWRTSAVGTREGRVGPMIVLPAKKVSNPSVFGSQWRSGINTPKDEQGLLPGSRSAPDEAVGPTLESEQNPDGDGGTGLEDEDDVEVSAIPEKESAEDGVVASALDYVSPTVQFPFAAPLLPSGSPPRWRVCEQAGMADRGKRDGSPPPGRHLRVTSPAGFR